MIEKSVQIPWMKPGYVAFPDGRIVRSELRVTFIRYGKQVTNVCKARDLIGVRTNGKGYARVKLDHNVYLVHRVIAELFVPNPNGKPQVNHKNGNKLDNRAENLEWVDNAENRSHAVENGLHARGERCSKKLRDEDVLDIRAMALAGVLQKRIATKYGVCQQTISNIVLRKVWTHLCDSPTTGRISGLCGPER